MTRGKVDPARSGSRDFSYLVLASVRIPWRCAVRRTEVASKQADSQMILVVVSLTAECIPPMTQAIATGQCSSAMTISVSVRVYSTLLSARIFSHFFAMRTEIFPLIFSASKACIGCPSSVMTRFVISTMSIFGLSPARSIMSDIPHGDFPTAIPSIFIRWYERQFFVSIFVCKPP